MSTGIAKSFKDLMGLRKMEPPQLEVCDPQIKGGTAAKHHVYKVIGVDSQGMIEIFRRFSHFYELRNLMFSRFLGLYIPPIPQKKKIVKITYFIKFLGEQRQLVCGRALCFSRPFHQGNLPVALPL